MGIKADAREQALSKVGNSLRALAANLIGIVRGAGKPLELGRDVDAFTAALGAFEGTTREHPKAWELAEMLRVDLEAKISAPTSEEEMAEQYAQHAIVQASLQLAATRLLRKEVEAAEAYADLHRALSGLEATKRKIERRRQEAQASMVAKMESHREWLTRVQTHGELPNGSAYYLQAVSPKAPWMNLSFYRFFFMSNGHTVATEVLQCDGDSAAIEKAKELLAASSHAQMVVWQGTRKVGVVEKGSAWGAKGRATNNIRNNGPELLESA